jgi:protease I
MAARKSIPGKPAKIAVLVENIYEDLELWYPVLRLREAGYDAVIIGPEKGVTYKSKHGYPAESALAIGDAKSSAFSGVIVPGGYAPDKIRRYDKMVQLVRDMDKAGKLVASICHGPWVLAEADIMRGRHFTCVRAIKTDIVNAGGIFHDQEVVADRNLITSRTPPDLPAFMRAILQFLSSTA